MKRFHRLLPLVAVLVLSLGCRPPGGGTSGATIRTFGSHPSPDATLVLHVTRRAVSLVDFTVEPAAGGTPLAAGELGSDAMRWFFYWEPPRTLWVFSSDTSYFRRFDFTPVPPSALPAAPVSSPVPPGQPVPRAVHDSLSSSLRSRYHVKK